MNAPHPPADRALGFIGLGAMGAPMARRLAHNGYVVYGYDPFPPPESTLEGIILLTSIGALAREVDTLICMVATPDQAEAALLDNEGAFAQLHADGTVIVMGTLGPDAVRALDLKAREAGVHLIDAPVSGGVARASTGDLLIMTSSRPEDAHRAAPILATLGSTVRQVGDLPGDGQVVKLVNQLLCGAHIAAAAEALALSTRLGVPAGDAWETVRHGAAASFMLDDRGHRMIHEEFEQPKSAVDIFVKDMNLVTRAAAASGMDARLATVARSIFQDASDAGLGRKDDSSIITQYL